MHLLVVFMKIAWRATDNYYFQNEIISADFYEYFEDRWKG